MTDPHQDQREEEQMARLLSAVDRNLPPPDHEFLARLREQSSAVFAQAEKGAAASPSPQTKSTRMWILRASILTTAAAVLAALCLAPTPAPTDVPFRTVMEKLNSAQTLQIRQQAIGTRSTGFQSVSWVRQPGQWRSEYVANGISQTNLVSNGRRWRIDESANQASSEPVSFGKRIPVEMFLFASDPEEPHWQKFLRQRPVETYQQDGVEIAVYRYHPIDSKHDRESEFYAEVDTKTGLLRFLNSRIGQQGGYRTELVAFNEPIPDEKFTVKETLTEDGRIGKLTDVQGLVAIKPLLDARWAPVCGPMLLKPGDWLRTDVRGANAVALELMKETKVILGPGSLAEFKSPTEIRLHYGEIEITAPEKPAVSLVAANQEPITLSGRSLYRLKDDKLTKVEQDPPWLTGFKGVRPQESIGSLVANIDGRNTPLTVGYHKVTVDIRDQIARTTIEESFVNHTRSTLEGVFHFPLPQDASISGFGMWIGDELVEADVVEKQRAREIYETILRERRDPGLLEWSGGNLFKARVFPIFGRSEKRIKITYTQVLPLKGNSYRYSYALQSELLKQHPLRELSIDVKLASVLPLTQITCPTHPARIDRTEHAGHVEFAAQEHTPTRDFEVLIETGNRQDVAVIPHRRGDDGYFMLLINPPQSGGVWQRDVLPKSQPLKLLLLADTSASLDQSQRTQQADFIAALCSSLTAEDSVNLACCDVACDWVFDAPQPANDANIARLREHLADRRSLGWTDLDKAFASALAMIQRGQAHFAPQASQNEPVPNDATHIVYIGDGAITTGAADPQAFVKRLAKLHAGKSSSLHAVAVGNTFEPAVLRGIAAQGGGSTRHISGEQTPQRVAKELLTELAQPGLRDIQLEFQGLRVARVYPERLPNLPAGSQQLILGRYLPAGRNQAGEVIVTARQGGKDVRFRTAVALKDAEEGNSFIPRLWARMHLDKLLEQGSSESIRQEIIALSEEYHIITPYTSLLVLESDEDRQRFKVQRRFQMRDGEKFFQEGRDQARFALMQQQMQRAAAWRLELCRAVLANLAHAGRDARVFQPQRQYYDYFGRRSGLSTFRGGGFRGGQSKSEAFFNAYSFSGSKEQMTRLSMDESNATRFFDSDFDNPDFDRLASLNADKASPTSWDSKDLSLPISQTQSVLGDSFEVEGLLRDRRESLGFDIQDFERAGEDSFLLATLPMSGPRGLSLYELGETQSEVAGRLMGGAFSLKSKRQYSPDYTGWVDELFPQVPTEHRQTLEPKPDLWPQAPRDLVASLSRNARLTAIEGGLEFNRTTQSFEARSGDLSSQSQECKLVSPRAWLWRTGGVTSQSLVQWCDAQTRGHYSEAFLLGRQRASTAEDLQSIVWGLSDESLSSSIYASYGFYRAEVRDEAEGRKRLVLVAPGVAKYQLHYVIDSKRRVVLAIESYTKDDLTASTKFSDFVEVAGMWWAGKRESFDKQNRRTGLVTQTVALLAAEKFTARMSLELASRDAVQLIPQPLPILRQAKEAAAAGKATFAEQFTLMLHFARSQQWPRVDEHLAACERLAADKPGVRWLRLSIYSVSRRHEELRKLLDAEAERLIPPPVDARIVANEQALAERVRNLARSVLESREAFALHRTLRPVYERQPAYSQAFKEWRRQEASLVEQTGQAEVALKLYEQFAKDHPRDVNAQREYVQRLANWGDYPAAYAWLDAALLGPVEWEAYEEATLRETYAQLLQNQGSYDGLVKFLAAWVEQKPQSSSAYQQYLSALIRNDQVGQAQRLVLQWLRDARQEGELPPDVAQKLYAAVQQAIGQGYNLYTHRVEPEYEVPLAEAALYFARHQWQASTAEQIMTSSAFQQTDAIRRVRREALRWLLDDAQFKRLSATEIARLVPWILSNDPAVSPEQWQELAAQIDERWTNEADAEERHRLGQPLVQVLSQRVDTGAHLAFLRRQWNDGPEKYRRAYALQLFDVLLAQPWSEVLEAESFALLPRLSDAEDATQRLIAQVAALYRWTDRMVAARNEAGVKAIEKPEHLTRTQLAEKQTEILRQARQGVADRLAQGTAGQEKPWFDWLTIERLYLDLLAGRDLEKVEAAAWEAVAAKPQAAGEEEHTAAAELLESILRDRYLATLANLAMRPTATPELRTRLLKYVDPMLSDENEAVEYWRQWKYRLLVGFDQPQALAKELQTWLRDDPLFRWRQALGYLLAEQGSLEAAVKLFEGVELADELGPAAYRTLADWRLALNQREAYEQALLRAFGTTEEYQLSQYLNGKLQPWRRSDRPMPSELDQEVLLAFRALFAKSGSPQNYVYQLREFYRATRDFRLLAVLADSVLGHSAGKVYPFLQQLDPVLGEIREEATADSLVERIAQVRPRANSAVDRRALDLLEALVERKAAELLSQPGPHLERSLAALKRSFDHELTSGEPRLLADLLSGLGRITQPRLADEQLRQLETLDRRQGESDLDRLLIADRLAEAYWNYQRHGAAIDRLEAAVSDHVQASGGLLISTANEPFSTLIRFHEQRGQFIRGEKLIDAQLAHPANRQQQQWLILRRFDLYREAIRAGGETSLGTGIVQFTGATRAMQQTLDAADAELRYPLIERLCQIYVAAHQPLPLGMQAAVQEDLTAFAFQRLPALLKGQTNHYGNITYQVAHTLHDLAGTRQGLKFLIERVEQEPAWLRYSHQDVWSQRGHILSQWRIELKNLGDLEPRLLKIVLAELRRDLATRNYRNRQIYHQHHGNFWSEQADAFAQVANSVLAERKDSVESVKYLARYFDEGLGRTARAAEILEEAHTRGVLDEAGTLLLVTYLHRLERYEQSIGYLEPLVGKSPDALNYRIYLMRAYFKTKKHEQLVKLLDSTDAHFHQAGRWTETVLAQLAASTLDNQLYERSVAYYKELIPLHERTQPGRGIGRGTLSGYYANLSQAHAGLQQTAEAVEAACGAIISWGPRHENRQHALNSLTDVLRKAPDLAAYVAHLDRQSAESGLHNPLVRKSLGQIYLERKQPARAIEQLKLALELQPNDAQTHEALLAAYDAAGDQEGAIESLFQAVQLRRRDLKLYRSLGQRLDVLERPRESERAYTSIVEMQPLESESHTLLAEIRQQQNRWGEAISHWRRVSEIRSLEPTGLLKLAEAQLHEKRWDEAGVTIETLRSRTWPERFGDVDSQTRQLQQRLERERK